jgi:hypothetical protein
LFLSCELAFPNADDLPPTFAQSARNNTITRDVLFKFRQPEINPRFRRVAEFATCVPVPEASVHENSDSLLGENEIGLSEKLLVASPSSDLKRAKQGNHPQLRVTISAGANPRHDRAALGRFENVRHLPMGTEDD